MRQLILLAVLGFAAALPAQVSFYTGLWTTDPSSWTVEAGSPCDFYGSLINCNGTETRLTYNNPPTQDYYIQTSLLNTGEQSPDPAWIHYLRASAGGYYKIRGPFYSGWLTVSLFVGGNETVLATTYVGQASVVKSWIAGNTIRVYLDANLVIALQDSNLSSGKPGIGTYCAFGGSYGAYTAISTATLGYADVTPPSAPPSLTAIPFAVKVSLAWGASTDNVPGSMTYKVYRKLTPTGAWTLVTASPISATTYADAPVEPATYYYYGVSAVDASGNESAKSETPVVHTSPSTHVAPDTGRQADFISSWGASPEKISLLTGSLAVRIPLISLKHRSSGPGFQMVAAWNSQFWQRTGTATTMNAVDVGYGLGWLFQIGAVYPIFGINEQITGYHFQDAGGVIHPMIPAGGTTYKSKDSTYVTWDSAARTLSFQDGSVWFFDCVSIEPEADAGTRYPTRLRDRNGNVIKVTYQAAYDPANGQYFSQNNTSGRILTIRDSSTLYTWMYEIPATVARFPHVTAVTHQVPGGVTFVDALFTYTNFFSGTPPTIVTPFASDTFPGSQRLLLKSITFTGSPSGWQFTYNPLTSPTDTGEITKIINPYGGYMRYALGTNTFSGPKYTREITARYLSADGTTGSETAHNLSHPDDSALASHSQTTLSEVIAGVTNTKVWTFTVGSTPGWQNGLESSMKVYQGPPTGTALQAVHSLWAQDDETVLDWKNPRRKRVVTVLSDGNTKTMQEVDLDPAGYGNVKTVREYRFYQGSDDAQASNPVRTTSTEYVTDSNYLNLGLVSLPTQVKVCEVAGCPSPDSVVTFTYDGSAVAPGIPIDDSRDAAYSPSFVRRGNVTRVDNNGLIANMTFDMAGNLLNTSDGMGHAISSVNWAAAGTSAAARVGSVTSGGLTTSYGYAPSGMPSTTTDPNSDTSTVNYNPSVFNQVTSVQYPNAATASFGYNYGAFPITRTSTSPLGRVSKTVYDGFGRVVKSAVKETTSPEVWIVTQTKYGPCSCSPLGRAVATSRPYRTDSSLADPATIYWTTSTFDALGRTTRVTLPDTKYTEYVYSVDTALLAASTLVTEPGGKQKSYRHDALGRLIRVYEPLTSSALVESARYTYDRMGRMLQVQMGGTPQGTNPTAFSQIRTFVYNGPHGELSSATNPENGTVNYTYRSDGLLLTKTDQKGQTLTYTYDDSTHKLTSIQGGYQTTSFRYGNASDPSAWKAIGRLVSATNTDANGSNPYTWWYAYDSMGRVSKQTLVTPQAYVSQACTAPWAECVAALQAQYTYDNDSRLTQIKYPGQVQPWVTYQCCPGPTSQPTDNLNPDGKLYSYAYNTLGQQTSMQHYNPECYDPEIGYYPCWQTLAHGATYNAAGQITTWKDGSETSYTTLNRSYDPMRGWLTAASAVNMYGPTYMNLAYSYNDNGRASTVTDNLNPAFRTTTYQYDNLNRLTQATTANNSSVTQWQLAWTYDEFGNRLNQTPTSGTPYSPPKTHLTYDQASNRINGYYDTGGNLITNGFSYDANGNLTSMALPSATTLGYDVFDRVKQVTKGANTYQYAYDAFGKRVAVTTNGDTVVHFYDVSGRLLRAGPYAANQVYFAGNRLGQYTDRLGSVRSTGGTTSNYYPYGEEIASTPNNAYKFAETFRDSDTGLDYAIYRCYVASLGRFLTADPSNNNWDPSNPQSWNDYAYTSNDPANANDPNGLQTCSETPIFDGQRYGIPNGITVGALLGQNSDLSIFAKTIYTEAAVAFQFLAVDEKAAIASVIMNRWQIVNGYWSLFDRPAGTEGASAPRVVPDWGQPDGSIASIVYSGQFEVWASPGILAAKSQNSLNFALGSDYQSVGCKSLVQSIATAASFWTDRNQHNLYSDLSTGLIYTGFMSGSNPQKSYYEQWIGSFGSGNVFSGVMESQVCGTALYPCPPPFVKTPPRPRRPVKQ